MKQRVLVVDDSAFVRRMIGDWVKSQPDMELVGIASNGQEAVDLARTLRPDVITLDVEMPVRNGISALEEIMAKTPTAVVMVSSVTLEGAKLTMQALELGAYDFVTKPQGTSSLKLVGAQQELLDKIRHAKHATISGGTRKFSVAAPVVGQSDKILVIASSTGGPRALTTLFASLPKLSIPIYIVQHMPAAFTESFAKRLDETGSLRCREARSGDGPSPGVALLAPGGFHMTLEGRGSVSLNEQAPRHGVRPAADFLFESAARCFGRKCLGVVLTGMGRDGAEGAVAIKKAGGRVLIEAESSCVIFGMPRATKELGAADAEISIERMGQAIVKELEGKGINAA